MIVNPWRTSLVQEGFVVSRFGMPPTRGRRLPGNSHNNPYERVIEVTLILTDRNLPEHEVTLHR